MIKCGECVRHDNCWVFDEHKDDNGTCVWVESKSITESSNELIERQNDVIEVVRCKDCRHYEQDVWREVDGVPIIVAHHVCYFWNGACHVKPDGFCSFGERREE